MNAHAAKHVLIAACLLVSALGVVSQTAGEQLQGPSVAAQHANMCWRLPSVLTANRCGCRCRCVLLHPKACYNVHESPSCRGVPVRCRQLDLLHKQRHQLPLPRVRGCVFQ